MEREVNLKPMTKEAKKHMKRVNGEDREEIVISLVILVGFTLLAMAFVAVLLLGSA